MIAPVTHVLPLTKMRRVRLLPVNGRVLVNANQKVRATDVIADAFPSTRHILLDLRAVLGPRRSRGRQPVERRVGENVQQGDIIASSGGLFRRILRAPENGIILAVSPDHVLMEIRSAPFKLLAGYSGEVTDIIPDRGIILETNGALVQGVWGNNQVNMGPLQVLAESPEDELDGGDIKIEHRGVVALAGHCSQADLLEFAASIPLHGLILSSMSPDLVTAATKLDMPIMLLEGFERAPINSAVYKLLKSNETRETALLASIWDDLAGERPEATIALPASGELPVESDVFTSGQTVLIRSTPYCGLTGMLENVYDGLTVLPNGLRVHAGSVRLDSDESVIVPLANLDVIK